MDPGILPRFPDPRIGNGQLDLIRFFVSADCLLMLYSIVAPTTSDQEDRCERREAKGEVL